MVDDLEDGIEEIEPIAPRVLLHLPLDVDHLRRQGAEAVEGWGDCHIQLTVG
jgi:hypothetical protein